MCVSNNRNAMYCYNKYDYRGGMMSEILQCMRCGCMMAVVLRDFVAPQNVCVCLFNLWGFVKCSAPARSNRRMHSKLHALHNADKSFGCYHRMHHVVYCVINRKRHASRLSECFSSIDRPIHSCVCVSHNRDELLRIIPNHFTQPGDF